MNNCQITLSWLSCLGVTASLLLGCSVANDNTSQGTGGVLGISASGGNAANAGQAGNAPTVTGGTQYVVSNTGDTVNTGGMGGTGGTAGAAATAGIGGTSAGIGGTSSIAVTGGTGGPLPLMDSGAPDGTVAADAGVNANEGGTVSNEGGTSNVGCEGNQALPPVTDFAQDGPFATTTETRTGPTGTETIFRPDPLGTDGFLHPIITFGPGMWTSGGTWYTALFTHLATLGYVVITVETLNQGPGAQANIDAMVNSLDWLIEQNNQAGVYQGKLAVNCGIAMGYSLGATATPFIGERPDIVTSVVIHGHKEMRSAAPRGPVLFLTGNGPSAVGDDVKVVVAGMTSAPGLMALYEGQGHIPVIWEQLQPGQPEFVAMTAWLRYWVNGDDSAKSYFWGPGCVMCSNPSWTMQGNALWDSLNL